MNTVKGCIFSHRILCRWFILELKVLHRLILFCHQLAMHNIIASIFGIISRVCLSAPRWGFLRSLLNKKYLLKQWLRLKRYRRCNKLKDVEVVQAVLEIVKKVKVSKWYYWAVPPKKLKSNTRRVRERLGKLETNIERIDEDVTISRKILLLAYENTYFYVKHGRCRLRHVRAPCETEADAPCDS